MCTSAFYVAMIKCLSQLLTEFNLVYDSRVIRVNGESGNTESVLQVGELA